MTLTFGSFKMSNYADKRDKIKSHLEELERKHRDLDSIIETRFNNIVVSDEVRIMKTQKLWLKDEIHRLNAQLIQMELSSRGNS